MMQITWRLSDEVKDWEMQPAVSLNSKWVAISTTERGVRLRRWTIFLLNVDLVIYRSRWKVRNTDISLAEPSENWQLLGNVSRALTLVKMPRQHVFWPLVDSTAKRWDANDNNSYRGLSESCHVMLWTTCSDSNMLARHDLFISTRRKAVWYNQRWTTCDGHNICQSFDGSVVNDTTTS